MKYNLNDYVTLTDFNNKDLKNQLEKEGLEIYFNNNLYSIRFNLEKIKRMLLNGEKIDKFDYKRYKADIDVFLEQNKKKLVEHIADPMHSNVVDFYSAENIKNEYGKPGITLEQYSVLTEEQQQDYEKNPFSDDYDDTYLYIKSNFYKNYTILQLYKLLKAQSSRDAINLLADTNLKQQLNRIEVKTRNNLLHIAVQNGLSDVAIKMLDEGAEPKFQNIDGNTPLHIAMQNNLSRVAIKMLDEGHVNPNIQNRDGNTPLHIAVQNGLNNVAIKMLDKGADPNRPNSDGNTPLHIAMQNGLTSVVNKINGNNKGGSIKKKGQKKISVNNIMAKSRRNVSRKKRQQKRRKSNRRSFRKMSGGTDISEEDKTFLLNLKWKHPITSNNPTPQYSSIQDQLNKYTDSSITWVDKDTINSIINSEVNRIYNIVFDGIDGLKRNANNNMLDYDGLFYLSKRIISALRIALTSARA